MYNNLLYLKISPKLIYSSLVQLFLLLSIFQVMLFDTSIKSLPFPKNGYEMYGINNNNKIITNSTCTNPILCINTLCEINNNISYTKITSTECNKNYTLNNLNIFLTVTLFLIFIEFIILLFWKIYKLVSYFKYYDHCFRFSYECFWLVLTLLLVTERCYILYHMHHIDILSYYYLISENIFLLAIQFMEIGYHVYKSYDEFREYKLSEELLALQ